MADAPPPDVTGSRVNSVIQVNVAFIILTTIVITLRVFARAYLSRAFGSDDCKFEDKINLRRICSLDKSQILTKNFYSDLICLGGLFAFGQGIVVIVGRLK